MARCPTVSRFDWALPLLLAGALTACRSGGGAPGGPGANDAGTGGAAGAPSAVGSSDAGGVAGGGAPTSISALPDSLTFALDNVQRTRESQTVTIDLVGDGVVAGYAAGVTPPTWLTVAQSGLVTTTAVMFALTVDASLLPVGEYATSVRFATGRLPPSGDIAQATDVVFADVAVVLSVTMPLLTVDGFCDGKAQAECQVAAPCATNATACKGQRKAACLQYASAATSGGRAFRPENGLGCIRQTTSLYAMTIALSPTELALVDDACNAVFRGNAALGGPCATKYDCADDVICDRGVCAAPSTVAGNLSCVLPGQRCATGFYCAGDTNSVCTPRVGAGDNCNAATPCLENLRCTGTGICGDRLLAGSPCASDADCAASAPYCDPAAGSRCDAGLLFAPGSPSCAGFGA